MQEYGTTATDEDIAALDSFDAAVRRDALTKLCAAADGVYPESGAHMNCHAHTFYSYNAYGYSPSHFALLAKQRGLAGAGIVDFDVLDALDEFLAAAQLLKLKSCVSIESRVFVPEFADRVINSPGEPGIAYHMGLGFTTTKLSDEAQAFLADMRTSANDRTRGLLERVNAFTSPVELDYEKDVKPLTPNGNATERHVCLAYARKAMEVFPIAADLEAFWCERLGVTADELDLPDGGTLQGVIRAKTMKRGGVGYVQPGPESFPTMADMNRFVLQSGAIPALTWLDGTSDGEKCIGELIEVSMASGVAAVNIIPDRNFTAGVQDEKLANLYDIVERAEALDLPVLVGTEMNSPGNKFVDDFDTAELAPLMPVFTKGMHIVYAHQVLQGAVGLGYLSDWASAAFDGVKAKNEFYETFGSRFCPGQEDRLTDVSDATTPDQILALL
ncbi:MAG: hypothetical protein HN341_08535 [Verrucomicrobia bacterium]|jgi:hypothetical protein|nr:hypothetical protein [Verrucomicrobiota bacterium]